MKEYKNIKIWLKMVLVSALFFVLTDMPCYSQVTTVQSDSANISQNREESGNANQTQLKQQEQNQGQEQNRNQARNQDQAAGQNQGNEQKNANTKAVKQVRSAKPDMSKARGARPNIVRPSGSNIPKGAGKPGGMKRIGGR